MGTFAPDDFKDRPYEGGMNQALHFVFGAAILGVALTLGLPLGWAVLLSGLSCLVWEGSQLWFRNARKDDYLFDLIYWYSGIVFWAWFCTTNSNVELAPCAPLVVWVVEYVRLKYVRPSG